MTNKIKKKPEGIFIPMVTPFNASDESIDFSGLKEVTEFLIDNGIDGLIPSGSTGEFVAMSPEEQKKVNAAVCEYAEGRVKVFCSTGAYRTVDAVDMSQSAEAAGADGVMVVTPWYMAPNEDELYDHYKAIRKAVSIPVMVYHNPYYSTCLMTNDFMAKLYNDGLIDAVKERQADVYNQQDLRAMTDDGFGIFYGYDICPVESVAMWADGWVCGTGNLFPKENKTVYDLAKSRKIEEAQKYHFEKIRPYLPLFTESTAKGLPCPWLSVIKEGLKLRGVNAGVARKPVMGVPDDVMAKLKNTLKEYGHI
jgi:4-hydroxy-tetrahydrodipicolinate synthase